MAAIGNDLSSLVCHGWRVSQTVARKDIHQLTHSFQLKGTSTQEDSGNTSPKRRRSSTSSSRTSGPTQGHREAQRDSPFHQASSQAEQPADMLEHEAQVALPKNETFSFESHMTPSDPYGYPLVSLEQPYMMESSFYSSYEQLHVPHMQSPIFNYCPNCCCPLPVDRLATMAASDPMPPAAPAPTPQTSASSISSGSSRSSTPGTTVDSQLAASMLPPGPCRTAAMQQSILASEAARDPSNHHCPTGRFQPELVRPELDSPPPKKRKSHDEIRGKRRNGSRTLTMRAKNLTL